MTELRSRRLRLRPCAPGDAPALHALLVHPEVRRWLLDDRVVEPAFVRDLVERSERSFAARGYGHFTLWEGPPGEPTIAGLAGLSDSAGGDPLGDGVEILWALARSHWGRGLAGEAVAAVLDFAFDACGLARVVAAIDSPNAPSRRLAARLGMRELGERPGDVGPLTDYELLAEAWRARGAGA